MSLELLASLQGRSWLEHMPWIEKIYRDRIELDAAGNAIVPDRSSRGFSFEPDAVRHFGA
jgi:hypothetical protein